MKIAILGIDGYLGWSLAMHLADQGYAICGFDDFSRRKRVTEMGSTSAIPIAGPLERERAFRDEWGGFQLEVGTTMDFDFTREFLDRHRPDAIVHFAEIPSAPYSMIDHRHTAEVMKNNVIGTMYLLYAIRDVCPEAHLVKLGTMGEYGTPNVDIPEGFFTLAYRGRDDRLPFPRQAGSWYHWSKVHDSNNVMYACDLWGLRSTDIMQGVVYGVSLPQMVHKDLKTRLDVDESFGTVINRFVAQAVIGHPLTVYGDIGGQTRGFLPLQDSMQCIQRILENPPRHGEYRVVNQFEDIYSIVDLAKRVKAVAEYLKPAIPIKILHYEAPRVEAQEHYYRPDHETLLSLGYEPTRDMDGVLKDMFISLDEQYDVLDNIRSVIVPSIRWREGRAAKVRVIAS